MFHQVDNLFFGRLPDGSVRILKFSEPPQYPPLADAPRPEPTDAVFDVTIPVDHWCSIIASVSKASETSGRFYLAQRFHNDENGGLTD